MSRKKRLKKLNPERNDDFKTYRSGENTLEWFSDSKGRSYIINIQKRLIKAKPYRNDEINREIGRRLNDFVNKAKATQENKQTQEETQDAKD